DIYTLSLHDALPILGLIRVSLMYILLFGDCLVTGRRAQCSLRDGPNSDSSASRACSSADLGRSGADSSSDALPPKSDSNWLRAATASRSSGGRWAFGRNRR